MKNTLLMLSLLITLGGATAAKAQKAYDMICYKLKHMLLATIFIY